MQTFGEKDLSTMFVQDAELRPVEEHIYSVLPDNSTANAYDTRFGSVYDWVACNPVYNRLIWGYSVEIFFRTARTALQSSGQGAVLDLGCGTLAFTAKVYRQYSRRPVVLVDQSLKMLRIAKARLTKMNGRVPDNLIFLQADASQLPFRDNTFQTVLSENLLHCLDETGILLKKLENILTEDGKMYFTTLVRADRLADKYLAALAANGKLISRSVGDHQRIFDQLGIPMQYEVQGNMLSMYSE